MTGSEENLHVLWSVHTQEEVFFTFEVNFCSLVANEIDGSFSGIYCAVESEKRRPSENV